MATLIVPPITADDHKISVWPSLGEQVAEWLEEWAVWGPGPKFGTPVTIDDDFFAWLVRAYQVFPKGHPREGRRRFDFCALELPKGVGKGERALQVGQAEFHPTAPVRTVDWERRGRYWAPVGGGVVSPRLVFLAYSEDQVQRTAFGRFRETLKRSPLAGDYHITQERIVLVGDGGVAAGEALPLPISPDSADGDLPTWQHIDEPHRWTENRHHEMLDTIGENALKALSADTWTMSTSTAGVPGQDSVEERITRTAEAIQRGELDKPGQFYLRRHCPDDAERWPLDTPEQVEAAVREARGPAAAWSGDIPRIVNRYFEPKCNRNYWERVWLNRWKKGSGLAFDPLRWRELARPGASIPAGALVTVGFDGARKRDSTGIVVTDVETGLQHVAAVWERPLTLPADAEWEIDPTEVDEAMTAVFDRYDVWRAHCDPPYWDDWVNVWLARWGDDRVTKWWTNKRTPMAHALREYRTAMQGGTLTHTGDPDGLDPYSRHVANAVRDPLPQRDEQDLELWLIRKDYHDSPDKIDLAMAGCLSWLARSEAIVAGALKRAKKYRTYAF